MPRNEPLHALTGVRFVAAVYVLLLHFGLGIVASKPRLMTNILSRGFVGVTLFFVLSGFILAYSYESVGDRVAFWEARFSRVYPNYFLALVLFAPFALAMGLQSGHLVERIGVGAACALLLQSWYPWCTTQWNPPAWSLSVEAVFYAIFPWVNGRLRKARSLGTALVVTWIVAMVPPTIYVWLDPDHADPVAGHWLDAVRQFPPFRVPDFVFGVLLGIVFSRHRHRAPGYLGATLSLTGAALTLAILAFSDKIPLMYLHTGLFLPVFGLVIYGLGLGGGPLAWFLRRPAMVLLGEASYGLYILQFPIAMVVQSVARRLIGRDLTSTPVAVAAMLIVIVSSIGAFRWFELPAKDRLRGWLRLGRESILPPPALRKTPAPER